MLLCLYLVGCHSDGRILNCTLPLHRPPAKQTDRPTERQTPYPVCFTLQFSGFWYPFLCKIFKHLIRRVVKLTLKNGISHTLSKSEKTKPPNTLFWFFFLRRASEAEDPTWQTEGGCRDYRSRFISHPYLKMLIILAIQMIRSV